MPIEVLQVDPRTLRLPWSRKDGADPFKLARQIAKHGNSVDGMPPLIVARGKDNLLQVLDGVTRATRVAQVLPGEDVTVEVTEDNPNWDFSKHPTIGEKLP